MIFKNKLKQFYFVIGIVFLFLIASPVIINAATVNSYACPECDALVCCGNGDTPCPEGSSYAEGETCYRPCTFNDMFCLVKKIIDFILFQLVPPLAVLWFAYAGFLMLTSGGDPGKTKQAKDMVTAAFIGIILVYSAWMLVYWFISFIGGPTQSNWLLQFFTTQTTP